MSLLWGFLGLFIIGGVLFGFWELSKTSLALGKLCGSVTAVFILGFLNAYKFTLTNFLIYSAGLFILFLVIEIYAHSAVQEFVKDYNSSVKRFVELKEKETLTTYEQSSLIKLEKTIKKYEKRLLKINKEAKNIQE